MHASPIVTTVKALGATVLQCSTGLRLFGVGMGAVMAEMLADRSGV